MKRFLTTILIYVIILFSIIAPVNKSYMQTLPENGTDKFKDVPHGIQIANFGSSHGLNGFNYSDINDKICFNFALGSQYPTYDLRIMKHYISRIDSGGVVFIPISYFSLFGPPEEESPDFLSSNKRYYYFLPKRLIKEYDFSTKIQVCFPILEFSDERLFGSFSLTHPTEINYWDQKTNPAAAKEHGPLRYERHIRNNLSEDGSRIYNHEYISAVYEMIQLCKDHEVEPILVTTPFLAEYPNAIKEQDPSFFQDFYGLIEEIQEKTGVRYYDYSSDERFSSSYHLFFNTDHLNKDGSRQFTNILIADTLDN